MARTRQPGKHGLSEGFNRIVTRAGLDLMVVKGKGTRNFARRAFHSLRHSFSSAYSPWSFDFAAVRAMGKSCATRCVYASSSRSCSADIAGSGVMQGEEESSLRHGSRGVWAAWQYGSTGGWTDRRWTRHRRLRPWIAFGTRELGQRIRIFAPMASCLD